MSTDRPQYDGAAYAIDRARRHVAFAEWQSVVRLANETLDAVQAAPYPLLLDRLYRATADAVLAAGGPDPDAERVDGHLREMADTVREMHVLAIRGETVSRDGVGGTRHGVDSDPERAD